jgi:hypothetical protein
MHGRLVLRPGAYLRAQQRAGELVQSIPVEGEYWSFAARHLLAIALFTNDRSAATPATDVDLSAILERLSDDEHVTALLAGETALFLSADRDWYLNAASETRGTILAVTHTVLRSHLHEQEQDERPLLRCTLVESGLVTGDESCDDLRFDSIYITVPTSPREVYGCPVHAARVLARHPTATVRTFTPDARDALSRLLPDEHPLSAPDNDHRRVESDKPPSQAC